MSGTSNSSPQSCEPENASDSSITPVTMTTLARTLNVTESRQTRKP